MEFFSFSQSSFPKCFKSIMIFSILSLVYLRFQIKLWESKYNTGNFCQCVFHFISILDYLMGIMYKKSCEDDDGIVVVN